MKIKINKEVFIITCLLLFYSGYICYFVTYFLDVFFNRKGFNVYNFIDYEYIPFLSIFIIPYLYYFVHVCLFHYILGIKNIDIFYKEVTLLFIASTIGAVILLAFPTYVINPPFKAKNIFDELSLIFYNTTKTISHAFPSFHCLQTICIWIGFRNLEREINKIFKYLTLLLTILICISTVFIKQHGFIDILGAIFIAEVTWIFVKKYNLDMYCKKILRTQNNKQ